MLGGGEGHASRIGEAPLKMRERPPVMPTLPVALKVRRTSAVLEYVTSIARFRCWSVRLEAVAFFSGLSDPVPTVVAHTLGLG